MSVENSYEMIMQAGFAAFAIILLAIIFWLIKQLIRLQRDTNEVLSQNNVINKSICNSQIKMISTLDSLYDKVISRPCIAKRE